MIPTIQRLRRNSVEWFIELSRKIESFSGRYGTWNVVDADQQIGFACRGAWHERLRFTRLYLGTSNIKRSYSLNFRINNSLDLDSQLDRFGLVLLNENLIPPSLQRRAIRVPRFVSLQIDLPGSSVDFLENLPADRRHRVKRFIADGYRVEYSNRIEFCKEFIEEYHEPTVRHSHGEEAIAVGVKQLREVFRTSNAEFMRIFQGDQCVLAGICIKDSHVYRLYKTGWLRGDMKWLRDGLQTFRVWSGVLRAMERGCSQLDLGGTAPLLDDGVFNYKMRWNAQLDPTRRIWGSHCLLIDPAHRSVQSFFQRHSMIVYDPENGMCVCSGARPEELKIRRGLLDRLSGWWRLASPREAEERGLAKEPVNGMPSGWFVRESF